MRLNKYIALSTGMSRRAADRVIAGGHAEINGETAETGRQVEDGQVVSLDGRAITPPVNTTVVMLNKPAGYVCSRDGQGNKTIYDILPKELHHLKPVGRLDKHSSGLLLLTNDGQLAHQLTHPSFRKTKVYKIALDQPLTGADKEQIGRAGIELDDGISRLELEPIDTSGRTWKVTMSEGRNRQIRRTFAALDYNVVKLHRTQFGTFQLGSLASGKFTTL